MTPADRDVLTSLPRTRPTRRSAKRGDLPGETAVEAAPPVPADPAEPPPVAEPAPEPAAAQTPPPAGWAAPKDDDRRGTGDLIGTAVLAVGEIAQIGLTYGFQVVRQVLSKLPKP